MTSSLNDRIARLRHTRVTLFAAIKAAWREVDPGYRQQRVQAATLALRSTDDEWDQLLAADAARTDRVNLAQLKHQIGHGTSPVRRAVASVGYRTKDMRPGR